MLEMATKHPVSSRKAPSATKVCSSCLFHWAQRGAGKVGDSERYYRTGKYTLLVLDISLVSSV